MSLHILRYKFNLKMIWYENLHGVVLLTQLWELFCKNQKSTTSVLWELYTQPFSFEPGGSLKIIFLYFFIPQIQQTVYDPPYGGG